MAGSQVFGSSMKPARGPTALAALLVSSFLFPALIAAVGAAAPSPPPGAALVYADLTVAPGDSLVLTRNSANVSGNVTLGAGSMLVLDGTALFVNTDASQVVLGPGALLQVVNGSLFSDSPMDVDNGSSQDTAYMVSMGPGSRLVVEASAFQGSNTFSATSAAIEIRSSFFWNHRGTIDLGASSSLSFTNVSLAGDADPVILLRGNSTADVRGGATPAYGIEIGSHFSYSSFVAVEVTDIAMKPLQGVDWAVEGTSGLIAGTPRFGGQSPLTLVDPMAMGAPLWVAVPTLQDDGASRTRPGAFARASYGGWSDSRIVASAPSQVISFIAKPAGVRLLDISHEAMLDNMGHDMMMMEGGSHDMMGMMDMIGPMMTQGPGAAWGDFNGDGNVDVVVTSAPETDSMMLMEMNMTPTDYPAPALFFGRGDGSFSMEMMTGLEAATGATGAAAGDFDGDGDLDLYIARYGDVGMIEHNNVTNQTMVMPGLGLQSHLYANNGSGHFTDVTVQAGVAMPGRHTVGALWGDYNRDGCLDLYVVNMGEFVVYMPMDGADAGHAMAVAETYSMSYFRNESNYLFKNDCDGTFTDVTGATGVTCGGAAGTVGDYQLLIEDPASTYWYGQTSRLSPEGSGISYTAAWIDFNEDGWPDLLVANDFGVSPLYRNNGDGSFTLWTEQSGLWKIGSAMGYAIADFNRDGHLDFFQTNFEEDYLWMANGDGTYTDRAREWGVWDMSVGWGASAVDVNLDGFPDIAMSVGYMSMGAKVSEEDVLFLNDGGKRFIDVSAPSGFNNTSPGISTSIADIDRDGRPDIFVGHTDNMNSVYLNRDAGAGVRIELRGLTSNSYGLGATITAQVAGKPFRAVMGAGGEYASSSEPALWIGLGSARAAQRVTVEWPSGVVQGLGDLASGTTIVAREKAESSVDAGPDGTADTSHPVQFKGAVVGDVLGSATYIWRFQSPSGVSITITPSPLRQ